ncbi:class I SAM-dependent methyltransferase [Nocardia sp. NPDC058480]|uniref:class I SAM-dependent methyltransferase n=1 Tax=Actinomycetes TaxID=1760 RepID=UPI0036636F61
MPQRWKSRPVFARFYASLAGPGLERAGVSRYRHRLTEGLVGDVLEVGAGPGANFEFYPPTVTRLVAIEPEPLLRREAERAAAAVPITVEVIESDAEHIAAEDGSFDAVVVSLVLCSVPDQRAALTEIVRVLKPGGVLRFFEHVRSESARMRRAQRGVDATVWPLLNGGCHTGRDTLRAFADAGFILTDYERVRFPDTAFPFPAAEHILGTALTPDRRAS